MIEENRLSSLENYKLYPLKYIQRAAAQPRLIQRLFPLFFLFDLNKCPLSSPRFTSPVCLFCCFIHVWFQSPFTAALLTSPFLTASLSLHPSLLPLCHHSSFQRLLCYLPKNVWGSEASRTGKAAVREETSGRKMKGSTG